MFLGRNATNDLGVTCTVTPGIFHKIGRVPAGGRFEMRVPRSVTEAILSVVEGPRKETAENAPHRSEEIDLEWHMSGLPVYRTGGMANLLFSLRCAAREVRPFPLGSRESGLAGRKDRWQTPVQELYPPNREQGPLREYGLPSLPFHLSSTCQNKTRTRSQPHGSHDQWPWKSHSQRRDSIQVVWIVR